MSFKPVGNYSAAPSASPSTSSASTLPSAGAAAAPKAGVSNTSTSTSTGTSTSKGGAGSPATVTPASYSPSSYGSAQPAAAAATSAAAVAGPVYPAYNYAGAGYSAYGGAAAGSSSSSAAATAGAGYGYGGVAGYDAAAYAQYAAGGGGSNGSGYGYQDYGGSGAGEGYEDYMSQQSIYDPQNAAAMTAHADSSKAGKADKYKPRVTVLKKGAGEVWEDQTLMEWDPSHFRLFIGDLGNDVNEDDLVKAFGPDKGWKSFVKAKVVRDKVTNKTRGYGFVAYSDPEDYIKAWKAMNGKYVGSRPITISKATTKVGQVYIGEKKAKELDTKKKPYAPSNKVRGSVAPTTGAWKPYIRR